MQYRTLGKTGWRVSAVSMGRLRPTGVIRDANEHDLWNLSAFESYGDRGRLGV